MRILLTGASGWLGRTLAPRLESLGHQVVGLDPVPSPQTQIIGSIADRELVDRVFGEHQIEAVIHSGALHKPDVARYVKQTFVDVNVSGTLNLLEAASAHGASRFVMTSTTSLMISENIRAGLRGGAAKAVWLTEAMSPEPRNIYGVTKLSAEHLCRLFRIEHGLPALVLRTARFFPEADDMAHEINQNDENTKANEFLFRRLTVEDCAEAHVLALNKAPEIGFGIFIVCAPTPFSPGDCADLINNAPAVVDRYFPEYREIYGRLGWTMFNSIDRVYDASLAREKLGFVCRTDFRAVLDRLKGPSAGPTRNQDSR